MTRLLAACSLAIVAGLVTPASAEEKQQEKPALKLVQTIPLPGVKGRLDHMGVDLDKKRLFVAAVANGTLEVVDLTGGKANLAALDLILTDAQIAKLNEVSKPALNFPADINTHVAPMFSFPGTTIDGYTAPASPMLSASAKRY